MSYIRYTFTAGVRLLLIITASWLVIAVLILLAVGAQKGALTCVVIYAQFVGCIMLLSYNRWRKYMHHRKQTNTKYAAH